MNQIRWVWRISSTARSPMITRGAIVFPLVSAPGLEQQHAGTAGLRKAARND
jgi:hypothetical protein